jgi:hypothetical protein
MEKIEFKKYVKDDLSFSLFDHDEEEGEIINEEPVRILFLGAKNTNKSFIINKILNPISDINSTTTQETIKFAFQMPVEPSLEIDILKFQNVEIFDSPGTNFCEIINKVKNKFAFQNASNKNDMIFEAEKEEKINNQIKEIKILESRAINNIKEYLEEVSNAFNLPSSIFNAYFVTFDYGNKWTFQEAQL